MLTVYAIPVSLYCAKLRILLRHKGLEWREIPPPGGYGSSEYKQVIPSGNLPALKDGGALIGDSEAIAEYLDEKHPEPSMLPGDALARAKAREVSRFHDTRLEPEVRALFAQIDPAHRDRARLVAQSRAISERLAQLERLLEGHSPAAGLTLGDCGYPVTFTWIDLLDAPMNLDIEWPEGALAYRERLSRITAVQDELAAYRPALETWLAGRLRP